MIFIHSILGGRAVLMSIIESFNYSAACVTPLQQSYNSLVLTLQCTTFILCSGILGSPILTSYLLIIRILVLLVCFHFFITNVPTNPILHIR